MEETGTRVLACSPNLPGAMDRQSWTLQDYRITNTLYSGYAAQVYTATCRYSGMEVVLKVYNDVNKAPDVAQHEMYREVAIQSSLQHHNIVHLFAAFQEGQTLVLVQEYAPGGDLLGLMAAHGGRADEATVVKTVLRPLLEALLYLHRWGIVHRDVKPENVLFAADGTVKLADFGLAINMVEERPVSRVGTLDYMAPEVLRCPIKQHMGMAPGPTTPARYGFATDCWAVGVVTFELLTGLPPYASDCRYQAEARIIAAAPPPFPHGMSHPARDFIRRLLAPIPGDRPTVRQLLAHPWILDPEACVSAHLHHQHAHAVSSASAHHYYHPLPQHAQHTGCSPLATAGGAATASSLSATAYSHAAAHVHAYAGAAAAYSPYGSAHAQAQAAMTSASVHATTSHQAQQQQQPSTSGGDATCSVAAGRTAVAHGLEQQPCAAGKQPSASAAAATQHAAAADPMLLSSYSTLPYTQASAAASAAAAAAAAAHQHHVHAMAASHPHPGAYHSSYHYHGSHGALNTPPSQAASSPAAPAAPQATLSIPTFSTGKHQQAHPHPHPHSHPQAPQPHQPHNQPAASAAPAAAESHPDPAVRQLNEQLRALQQHQLLDLSKLPLDQIQGVIAKLQEAMRIAVVHQQQQQQQHAHCSTDGGVTAASAAASPAPTAPSAVSAAAARAAAIGTADVQMEEAADVGASQTGACGSAAAPAAAAAATPVASGSCVHSSCHSPHSPLSVARRNAAAATASTGGAAPYVQQAPHEPQSAATPFAFAASLASHILHHASTAMTAAAAAGSDSASHASTTTPVGFGAHAGPSSSSLTASRRTTAEATGPAIACCQGALTAEAVTAALLGMAHQQFQQHQQGTSAAATPAPAQCGSSQEATPRAAVFEATLHSHSRAHTHAHTPLVIPAPPAAAPASTSAGGAVPMDRASGGGGVHDGDGLVYVSIGSSRKLPAGSVGGAPPTQALVVVGGNDAAAAGAGSGEEDELQRAARQVAATWFQQQPQQQQQLAAATAAMS
ncbi:hypothetical protein CHLRE_17g735550v5 [Chlamydomonas reinhardtii]|uniref:Protein kinase domain-containing protein n=1 Tax=Chlamydomonas reinhardtii TaxID=3055 RepID=A0A2K3CRD4_CHLRE|nr:uncharacterized protein CHLRE_17g735550v5 [Chlamydomonas reinhardtii]PNW70838.1 hypothetical protein CHLRE_17g735550v5 [Chlamydomonas reinhardtii]